MKDLTDPPAIVRPAADALDELAARINTTHAVAEEATRKGLERYREVGLMLTEAKKKCGHGKWLPWLKANVKFTERHARRYIELSKSDVTSDLEGQWRAILGNAASDEPEEPAPAKPPRAVAAPKPVEPEPDPGFPRDDAPEPFDAVFDAPALADLAADQHEPEPEEPEPEEPEPEEPQEEPAPATLSMPKTPVLKDGLGNVVPRGVADTFGDPMLTEAIARIDAAHKELVSIESHVIRTLSRKGEFWPYALFGECAKSLRAAADRAAEASAQLFAGVPFCVCPKCRGDGCTDCRNSGAWPRHRHDNRAQYGDAA